MKRIELQAGEKFGELVGSLNRGQDLSRKLALVYTGFSFFRRLAMAMFILTFYFHPVIQVLSILGLNLATLAFILSNQMLKSRLAYCREIMNEAFCLMINYVLLCFTNDYM